MAWRPEDLVQRGHHYAIIDEVDSILIDEARTPLIISGPASGDANKWYAEFAKLVLRLKREDDYEVDEKKRTVGVLETGIAKVEDYLGIENLYESLNTPLIGFLNNAIKAKELFTRDKDYVVMGGEVLIVDEHTGRMLAGRRYNEGMHQSIEAKEGVVIKAENQTLATITLQNFFRLYDKLAGMTGTAQTEAAELMSTYKLGVVPIPTNMPMIRGDQPDLVYKNEDAKFVAVVSDIVERHAKGQPVLVGTVSVEKSEHLSKLLRKQGVPHDVLNAKQHDREAMIVAQAGRKGAVTVATNMAGRGTDIMLGGNAEFMAVAEMAQPRSRPGRAARGVRGPVARGAGRDPGGGGRRARGGPRAGRAVRAGHRAPRVAPDRQPAARTLGPPGRPGGVPVLPVDDRRPHAAVQLGLAESMMNRAGFPDDLPIESKMVSRGIQSAQGQVEARNFEIRKNVLKYDDVMSRQREVIYDQRRRVLEGEDMAEQIQHFIGDVIGGYVLGATAEGTPESWDLEGLWTALKAVYPVSLTVDEVVEEAGSLARLTQDLLVEELVSDAKLAYAAREEEIGEENMRTLERRVVLSVLDRKWREHLYEMDYLKEGIGLRAMAQRDPLVEYQREGFQLFEAMSEAIKEESVTYLFNLEVKVADPDAEGGEDGAPGSGRDTAAVFRAETGSADRPAAGPAARPAEGQSGEGQPAAAPPAAAGSGPAGRPRRSSPRAWTAPSGVRPCRTRRLPSTATRPRRSAATRAPRRRRRTARPTPVRRATRSARAGRARSTRSATGRTRPEIGRAQRRRQRCTTAARPAA